MKQMFIHNTGYKFQPEHYQNETYGWSATNIFILLEYGESSNDCSKFTVFNTWGANDKFTKTQRIY